jgi:alpha-tubulin suppressor-like RCC1 family protein
LGWSASPVGRPSFWGDNTTNACGTLAPALSVSRWEVSADYSFAFFADGSAWILASSGTGYVRRSATRDYAIGFRTDVPAVGFGQVTHRLILGMDGRVIGSAPSGSNAWGQATPPTGLSNVVEIAASSDSSAARRVDGVLVCWGKPVGFPVGELGISQLTGAAAHFVAARADGTVLAWGEGIGSQAAEIPSNLRGVAQVAAGYWHNAALRQDGSVTCWGANEFGQCNVPAGLGRVRMVACGRDHTTALLSDGSVVTWGTDSALLGGIPRRPSKLRTCRAGVPDESGYIGWLCHYEDGIVLGRGLMAPPGDLGEVDQVSASYNWVIARRKDGTVRCWGDNSFGQCSPPADLGTVVAVDAGQLFAGALESTGTVRLWGDNLYGKCSPPSSRAAQLDLGNAHAAIVRPDGSVACWGYNALGQCDVPSGLVASSVRCGFDFTLALTPSGGVRSWGSSDYLIATSAGTSQIVAGANFWGTLSASGNVTVRGGTSGAWVTWDLYDDPRCLDIESGFVDLVLRRCTAPRDCPSDINRDLRVDGGDLAELLSQWNTDLSPSIGDINRDGRIDARDLGELLSAWGACGS